MTKYTPPYMFHKAKDDASINERNLCPNPVVHGHDDGLREPDDFVIHDGVIRGTFQERRGAAGLGLP